MVTNWHPASAHQTRQIFNDFHIRVFPDSFCLRVPAEEQLILVKPFVLRDEPNAVLSCERDTDQHVICRLSEYDDVVAALRQVVEYCENGEGVCSTFLYQQM